MFHSYNILLLLSLCFIYSLSKDIQRYYPNQTVVSSRSIYELAQLRRTAARFAAKLNRTHRTNSTNKINPLNKKVLNNNIYTPRIKTDDVKNIHDEFLYERLKIVIIISLIALLFSIIIVIICIVARYYQAKNPIPTERPPPKIPLNSPGRTYRTYKFSQINPDKRNFSRKRRALPTAV